MKDSKLNNLLSIDTFTSVEKLDKKTKVTKRTGVAKDVLQEQTKLTGKDVLGDHLKNKEVHAAKGLNNLMSLTDFTKNVPATKDSQTKRTSTAKDVLLEKKDKEEKCDDDCCDKCECDPCECDKKGKKKVEDKEEEKEEKTGLTPAQKKLPDALQKAILKRQGKK